jgi:hypothetical protein
VVVWQAGSSSLWLTGCRLSPANLNVPRTCGEVKDMELANLKTPKQIVDACPGLTMGGLRTLLFHSRTNGLEGCVVRLGRKLLIDEAEFVRWLGTYREQASGAARSGRRQSGGTLAHWGK